ncbi:MAG: Asp-tRNA(Asn)/Glu-tRNA(Gln) amidotransferase subunit GatB [Sphingobacteriales bacterium]|nr:Asp-tRNA(Asn)/Glu-tRNA(Gln) amidotransferase subunit GatB [Sphingobacteriales bacterium]MBI3719917.1 Asp-tRNA(Asn)/Glu-tRNA(Gln) amidotransferase subunit GatB [Sphingobacteriales bacterium]
MINYDKYEAVIGLEVHAQLLTQSKLFCGDSAAFVNEPNTHISPITMAHPGTLPKLNDKAIEYAIKLGLACNCEIEKVNYFARKNYFYPDLPKGYQVSQHTTPICKGGYVTIKTEDGEKKVQLNRIHIEEDAGKSIHDQDEHYTYVDLNRAGVPLCEIVTEPDLCSGDEAYAYLTELRRLVRWIEVCDGNMEEGSMRCDANVSIRLKGETKLGTKVEVKNLNSIRNVKRAIDHEIKRMIEEVENGGTIIQQTRSFDANNGTTFALRTKEEANDYRYFADPDLTPFHISDEWLKQIQSTIPELYESKVKRYIVELQLTEYDAKVIADERETADYFEKLISALPPSPPGEGPGVRYKAAANWMIGPIKSYLNENNISITKLSLTPSSLAEIIALIDEGKINFSVASSKLFPALIKQPNVTAAALATQLNLLQTSDSGEVASWVEEVLNKMPDKVAEYRKGKKGLIGLFVGEVKKLSKGKADPKLTNDLLLEKLNA